MTSYMPLLGALTGSLAVLSLFLGLYRLIRPSGELEGRLEDTARRTSSSAPRVVREPVLGKLKKISLDKKLAEGMAVELVRADMALTVNEYVLIRAGGGLVGFLIGAFLFGQVLVGLVLVIVAFQVPVLVVSRRFRQRQQRFQSQLVDVITMLSSGLRAGVGLMQAMDLVRREMPAPVSDEFGRLIREVGLGVSLEEALDHLLQRMPGDDLNMLVTVIKIQAEVGGNLVNILDTVVNTIRERVRIAQEIRTLTAQQRMTGYLLGGLPFFVGGALMLINPTYMGTLFEPRWLWLPAISVVSMAIGFFIINRIVDIKV